MENSNVVNDTQQAVVESAQDSAENSGTISETSEKSTNAEAAPRKQSKSENRAFAELRREKENADVENIKLISALSALGYSGSADEISEQIEAKKANVSVDALRVQKQKHAEAVKNDPEFKAMEKKLIDIGLKEDLKVIREIDSSVQSIDDVDPKFLTLRANGIDAKTAYLAIKGAAELSASKPESIGPVGTTGNTDSEYFTREQLLKLTPKDLEDPRIYKKARKSMTKL